MREVRVEFSIDGRAWIRGQPDSGRVALLVSHAPPDRDDLGASWRFYDSPDVLEQGLAFRCQPSLDDRCNVGTRCWLALRSMTDVEGAP
jgi:hypothetical protein